MPDSWRALAACRDAETALFFDPERVSEALAVCRTCPVIASCRADARRTGEATGVRGGIWLDAELRSAWAARKRTSERRRRGLPAAEVALPEKPCRWCTSLFTPQRSEFCSDECRRAADRVRKIEHRRAAYEAERLAVQPRPCRQCGTSFVPARDDTRFCSPRCGRLAALANLRSALPSRACRRCGVHFQPRMPNQLYCSMSCGEAARRAS